MLRKDELLNEKEQLFSEAQELLRAESIDEKAINEKQMRMAEINGMIKAIDDAEKEEEARSTMSSQLVSEPTKEEKDEKYRSAFDSYLRRSASQEQESQLRTMSVGTDTAGGYLVPDETAKSIIELKEQSNTMRELASTMTIKGEKKIPLQGTVPSAEYIAENGTYPTGDASFSVKTFEALKNGIIIPVSDELVADNEFNLEGYLNKKVAESTRALDEDAFVNGTGTNAPRGVLLDADTGVTAASATAITAQEILNLIFSLKAGYKSNAKMLMAQSTLGVIRGLWVADTQTFTLELRDGRYWVEGVPVYVSDAMPAIATGNSVIAYGDFSYYQIADRTSIDVKVLTDGANYGEKGQVGFRYTFRNDGKLLVSEAIKTLVMA